MFTQGSQRTKKVSRDWLRYLQVLIFQSNLLLIRMHVTPTDLQHQHKTFALSKNHRISVALIHKLEPLPLRSAVRQAGVGEGVGRFQEN